MKEKISGFWEGIKVFWASKSKKARILLLSGLAAVCLIALSIVMILNHTDYIVLYDGLSAGESAEVLATLQEMGVQSTLENNRVLIPKQDELAVRMQLATKGYANSGFDYSTFDKGSSLTATQFEKTQYATYQLQERLQATIKTFPEVQEAIVNISVPEKNAYVLQQDVVPPTASVKLTKRPGKQLTSEQIHGIINIVRDSVPGLVEDNISISDEAGDLKGIMDHAKDANTSKLSLTEQVNQTVRRRVMELISPIYGAEKVAVAVNSVLDIDQRVTDKTTYIPFDETDPRNNPLDSTEHLREGSGQNPYAEGVPGANDNVDVPQYGAQLNEDEDAGYYSSHDIYDYLVSSVRDQIIKEGLYITDMTVAVVIDAAALPDGERDLIIDSVATAAGVSREKVSVQSLPFVKPAPTVPPEESQLRRVIIFTGIALSALVLGLVLGLMLYSRRKKKERLAAAAAAAEQEAYEEEQLSLLELMGQAEEPEFEPITLVETQEQKLRAQIRALAESDPEIVAQLIKTWLYND